MIITLIAAAVLWLLFGKKGLAWAIMLGAIIWSIGIFVAPPIPVPASYNCRDDLMANPPKICDMTVKP